MMNEWWNACALVRSRITVFTHPLFIGKIKALEQQMTRPEYRQGSTLGSDHKYWFRAKFFKRYRLFFRYHASSKGIVFAWVNEEDTKRAFESSDDAYRIFREMFANGQPPSYWEQLLAEARA
jgi:toxin YhaV